MPGGDGMGPPENRVQRGRRMAGNKAGAGPGGYCICPECGESIPHKRGIPCFNMGCPKCGTKMVRK